MNTTMIESLTEGNRGEAEVFLAAREDTSQFLINNLKLHGPELTSHHNSGNFRLVRQNGVVAAVFCLTRRGNLLIQADSDFSEMILNSCQEEEVPLKGFIGAWDSVAPIWMRFKKAYSDYTPSYESKEILYSYILSSDDPKLRHDARVRFLEEADFEQWLQFSISYMAELGLPDGATTNQKRDTFIQMVRDRLWWGLFSGSTLLSRTALNSKGTTVGQVGGVFTPQQYRQKGLAKATMFHMLKDCRDLHGHTKNILFTGESDIAAQKLYESMGYQRIGSFELILG
jgi:predicted GNAT family acetyltransferase